MILSEMKPGQKASVIKIVNGSVSERRLFEIGIVPGASLHLLSRHPFHGPLIIQVGGSKIALGRRMAKSVEIELAN